MRDKTPSKSPRLNRSITEKMIKQIKYHGLPQFEYEIIDTDKGNIRISILKASLLKRQDKRR